MKSLYLLFLAGVLLQVPALAQQHKPAPKPVAKPTPVSAYAAIDPVALAMPDSLTHSTADMAAYINAHFQTAEEKLRAIFIWEATRISYDVDNMYAINFYEKQEEKVRKPLQTRKGICENYAALFNELCAKTGVTSFEVTGYTKQNGRADYLPHAWCVAQIDNAWYGFDPTFGAGYLQNNKFVAKVDNTWFKTAPRQFIKTHMPFDYLWQCLDHPVTYPAFIDGKTPLDAGAPSFAYADSIAAYAKATHREQMKAEVRRINANGTKNSLVFDRLQHVQLTLENEHQAEIVNLYNFAANRYNDAVNGFNTYINYYNKKFTPERPDAEIQKMLDGPAHDLQVAKDKLAAIQEPTDNVKESIGKLDKAIDDVVTRVKEQQDWLAKYIAKGKFGRHNMFVKYTWFGAPLN